VAARGGKLVALTRSKTMTDWLLASGHHILLLLLVSVLAGEAVLLRQNPSVAALKALGRLDAIYGASAGLLLLMGGARLTWGAKDIAFYSGNMVFWLKMALFVAIGLLSIIPTLRFIRWRRAHAATGALPDAQAWAHTRKLAMTQLHILPLVAIAAAAMARGIGF
jgi:putative membrane protein